MREIRREPKVPEEKVPVMECLDGLATITSKELAITHFVNCGTLQNACSTRRRVVANSGKSTRMHIVRLMNNLIRGPKRMMTKCSCQGDLHESIRQRAINRQKVTTDWGDPMSTVRLVMSWDKDLLDADHRIHDNWVVSLKTWSRRSPFSGRAQTCRSQSTVRNSRKLVHFTLKFETKIFRWEWFFPGEPHERSPNAPKFEDRSLEETEWQEQGARGAAWKLVKSVLKLKEHERTTFFSPSENRCLLAFKSWTWEREFVVDSGASMHMISKKDLSDVEMDTLTKSCSLTIVINANGEVQTHEEAIVYVKELDLFLTMKVLDNTSAVLSLGKLCDENGYSYEWINGQKPHLIKKTGLGYSATRRTSFLSWFQAYQVRLLDLHQFQGHLRDRRVIPHHLLQPHLLHLHELKFRLENEKIKLRVTSLQCTCHLRLTKDRRDPMLTKRTKLQKPFKKETERTGRLVVEGTERLKWLQEFREDLVHDEFPEHGDSHTSSSHDVSSEPIFKRREDLVKHSVSTRYPKDRNCEICKKDQNCKGPAQKTQILGDLITADHKVLSDNCESRNNITDMQSWCRT